MKIFFVNLLSLFLILSNSPVFSEETGKEKESQTEQAAKKTDEKDKKENSKEKNKKNGPILVYPELADEFRVSYNEADPMEHIFTNFGYGLISGGIIGMGAGLSFFKNPKDLTPLYLTAAGVGGAGAIAGIIVAIIENDQKKPFVIGAPLFQYTWYGVIAGALVGGAVGLIPYSTSKNPYDILNWVGYGTFGGIAAGVALYFIVPKNVSRNIILDINPVHSVIGYNFRF